ncbi:carboxymuconolactone decarboxylase family protein [Amylibacter sp. SFDW26]|uniref:carboxymuconolactone decarboxylase family protein n=1 Tax=Amylibacter sp. SFDW26 TaxID=2652722 RepID=UPI001261450F|nr:carboxymuconolactone decarboxylase family protein [Amylibacter sp. SFDW26]KAB7615776.1 carboxymuconolactone decarboxylase family protein [Amylibacter sp. SFDW26]
MTTFTRHTIETAPEAAKPVLEETKAAFSFVPNLLANMAEAPALLKGYMELAATFDTTSLTVAERQIVLMTNNRLNGCTYCMAAHTSISQMQGVAADVIEALRNNTPIADPKLEALRQFSIIVNETRGYPSDAQVTALLDAGYTNQTILEVILGTSLKVMSNYTNHIAHTEVDEAFQTNAWAA